ncbi:MAG: AAA family ATPase [Oscillospiraceae bacterium]|nr:AAA family ATPase [Oscillospiraceae bacterium]
MKLTSITLKNLKCFSDFVLNLQNPNTEQPLQVCALVGANGSGKTTILKSIVSTFSIANKSYGGDIFDKKAIRLGEKFASVSINFLLNDYEKNALKRHQQFSTISSEYDIIKVEADSYEEPILSDEVYLSEDIPIDIDPVSRYGLNCFMTENFEQEFQYGLSVPYFFEKKLTSTEDFERETAPYAAFLSHLCKLNGTLIVYFDAFRYLTEENPASPNFSNTITRPKVSALSSTISKDGCLSPRYFDLKQWFFNLDFALLKKPNPHTEKIRNHFIKACNKLFDPLQFYEISELGEILFKDIETEEIVNLNMLSDGFKSVFIIIAELLHRLSLSYNPEKNENIEFYEMEAVVLIDEIDCHIHPRWQTNLLPALTQLFPNCQFIVTTHSPFILKKLEEYEIKQIGGKIE